MRIYVIAISAFAAGCVADPWQDTTPTHAIYRGQDNAGDFEPSGTPPFILENDFVQPQPSHGKVPTHRPTPNELAARRNELSNAKRTTARTVSYEPRTSNSTRVERSNWLTDNRATGVATVGLFEQRWDSPAVGTVNVIERSYPNLLQPASMQTTPGKEFASSGNLAHDSSRWPRTWVIEDVFQNRVLKSISDTDPSSLDQRFYKPIWKFTGDLFQDNRYFYDRQGLTYLGLALGGAAILANTDADENFRQWFLENASFDPNRYSWGNIFGEVWIVPSIVAVTWGVTEGMKKWTDFGYSPANLALGQWSQQSLRGLIVTAVPVFSLQWILGASRPGEDPLKGSSWKPFDDNNSVSGHAAIGAVPFLVAAKMSDSILMKGLFVAGSGIAGYARLREDRHYLSQVLLGWTIAYLAVEATDLTEHSSTVMRIVPVELPGVYGIGLEARY